MIIGSVSAAVIVIVVSTVVVVVVCKKHKIGCYKRRVRPIKQVSHAKK